MNIKLSEIEKVIEKKIVIIDGVPQRAIHKLNGEIIFNELTNNLVVEINEKVVKDLADDTSEEEIAFMLLPYLVNVENDISLDNFNNLLESKNPIIVMLYEGLMECIEEILHFSEVVVENKDTQNKIDELQKTKIQTIEEKIKTLTVTMEEEKDFKKKRVLIDELSILYKKIEG